MLFNVKKFVVLTSLFVLFTNVWGMPEKREHYDHIRRWSMPELWSIESSYDSDIFRFRSYSDLNEYKSQIEGDTDSINMDIFLNELIEIYAEEETDNANTDVSLDTLDPYTKEDIDDIDIFWSELIEAYAEEETGDILSVKNSKSIPVVTKEDPETVVRTETPTKKSSKERGMTTNKKNGNLSKKKEKNSAPKSDKSNQSKSVEQKIIDGLHEAQEQKKQVQKKLKRKNFRENFSKFLRNNVGAFWANIVHRIFKGWRS